jgi:hypothetical protein
MAQIEAVYGALTGLASLQAVIQSTQRLVGDARTRIEWQEKNALTCLNWNSSCELLGSSRTGTRRNFGAPPCFASIQSDIEEIHTLLEDSDYADILASITAINTKLNTSIKEVKVDGGDLIYVLNDNTEVVIEEWPAGRTASAVEIDKVEAAGPIIDHAFTVSDDDKLFLFMWGIKANAGATVPKRYSLRISTGGVPAFTPSAGDSGYIDLTDGSLIQFEAGGALTRHMPVGSHSVSIWNVTDNIAAATDIDGSWIRAVSLSI